MFELGGKKSWRLGSSPEVHRFSEGSNSLNRRTNLFQQREFVLLGKIKKSGLRGHRGDRKKKVMQREGKVGEKTVPA